VKNRKRGGTVGGLSAVAVEHEPDVFWRRYFAGIADDLALVFPRRESSGEIEMRREVEQFALDRGAAEEGEGGGNDCEDGGHDASEGFHDP